MQEEKIFDSKLYGKGLYWNDGKIMHHTELQFVKCPVCFGKMPIGNNVCSYKCYQDLEVTYAIKQGAALK